jgi:hypothetical protein
MNGQLKFLLDSSISEILKYGKLLAINNTEQRIVVVVVVVGWGWGALNGVLP